MSDVDIIKFIESKKNFIEMTIERYIPKEINQNNFRSKSRYDTDFKALNYGISKPLWDFLGYGGKRWRPVLFLLVSEALGADMKKVSDFLVIPEIAHNGTIIIDDIEDSAELRRGKPALHKVYGEDIAINCGNAMYFLPLQVIDENKDQIPLETLYRVYSIYNEEMRNLHYGQALDISWHKGILKKEPNVNEYLQMTAFKTGTLARMAARLAVALSGKEETMESKFGKFAESIGIAFQIQDDLLDIMADKSEFGKRIGGDLMEGKKTFLFIEALEKAKGKDKNDLLKVVKNKGIKENQIEYYKKIYEKLGVIEDAKVAIRNYSKKALKSISMISNKSKVEIFYWLADSLIKRNK